MSTPWSSNGDPSQWFGTWEDEAGGATAVLETPDTSSIDPATKQRFVELVQQWRANVAASSSTTQRVTDPAYLEIIALGDAAVPLILKELEHEPNHWFEALRTLTGENPVRPGQRGNMRAMADAWVSWGRQRGAFVSP